MYREPAFRIWEPAKGDWWKGLICALWSHDEERLFTTRYEVEPPYIPNDPKPARPAFPVVTVLHWISEIEHRVFRCKRCGKQWDTQHALRSGEPIEYTRWLILG